eukprot:TRINITY_DN27241_c0_g1_i1.p2 TRINITY_DN27241_c0_g1~~TRINITY_DN27241_c0_g1_i1.p2  ORF type:complete len:123 (+),score=29.35 TRINITY_DN27241_c0_g1_i1:84-452(+)
MCIRDSINAEYMGLAQKPWIVPIPGTSKIDRLIENLGASSFELTESELQEIETAAAKIKPVGDRYSGGSAKKKKKKKKKKNHRKKKNNKKNKKTETKSKRKKTKRQREKKNKKKKTTRHKAK